MLRRTFIGTLASTTLAGPIVASTTPAQASNKAAFSATRLATLPACNMGALVAAAQAEWIGGNKKNLGDDASTRLVQAALTALGFRATVDGWYGPGTRGAYSSYQRSLGFGGIAANGLPGVTSLTKLAAGRFQIDHKVQVGSTSDTYSGKRVNTRTKRMLTAADGMLPWRLTLTQGEYSPGEKDSAHAHDGGGCVDISTKGLSASERWKTIQALRTVGFAAWFRTDDEFPGKEHIHAMAIGDPDAHEVAAKQVADYITGKNGLANHGPDNTPARYRMPFTWWEKYVGA